LHYYYGGGNLNSNTVPPLLYGNLLHSDINLHLPPLKLFMFTSLLHTQLLNIILYKTFYFEFSFCVLLC